MNSLYLQNLTWVEAEAALQRIPTLLLPIGAILKEHGPHLPLQTDYLLALELARRVAEQVEVIVCPPLTFGYYPAFVNFPGSTNLSAETFREMIEQVIESLARNGAQRFLVLNTGVSTTAPLLIAANNLASRGIRIVLANIADLGHAADHVLENRVGTHANEHETSMLLAIDAAAVHMERALSDLQPWMQPGAIVPRGPLLRTQNGVGAYCPSGVIGDPTRATKEKGEAILAAMTTDVARIAREWK